MTTVIEVSFPGGKRVDARIDGTHIRTDQSKKDGGDGSAPQPFQLFLASIATCAGIYAWQFCQTRHLSTEGLDLKMHCDFDPAQKRYREMTLLLTLPKEFPEQHKESILRAIDLCAVKKHIMDPPAFKVEVESSSGRK
ncbi:MAG: OsmC family protein [Gammaproteobacteria bacterium]|jgi:ribosomal protein S12 methylthiotransferase accessory factor